RAEAAAHELGETHQQRVRLARAPGALVEALEHRAGEEQRLAAGVGLPGDVRRGREDHSPGEAFFTASAQAAGSAIIPGTTSTPPAAAATGASGLPPGADSSTDPR